MNQPINLSGVVRVCPNKDTVCGDVESHWCDTCPKKQTRVSKETTLVTLQGLKRLADIAQTNGTLEAFAKVALQWAEQAAQRVAQLENQVTVSAEERKDAARYRKIISKEHTHPLLRKLIYYASQSRYNNYTTPESVRAAKTLNDMVDAWRELPD